MLCNNNLVLQIFKTCNLENLSGYIFEFLPDGNPTFFVVSGGGFAPWPVLNPRINFLLLTSTAQFKVN